MICPSCGQARPATANYFNPKFPECFGCRVKGVGFAFGAGGKEGRQQFHDQTHKEYVSQLMRETKNNGIEAVPVHTATTAAPTRKMLTDLKEISTRKSSDAPAQAL